MLQYWEFFRKKHNIKYDLSISNPPALKEEEIKELKIKLPKLDLGKVYHGGSEELKRILAKLYSVSTENVFIGSSASDINDTIFDTLIQKGDNILIESPAYQPLLESAKRRANLRGAEIKQFSRKFENKFQISIDEIYKLINKKTRLIVITNLHNPSGVKTEEEKIKQISKLAKENNTLLIVDEVYRRYCPNLKSAYPLSKSAIITDSLSKYFGATALRIGWAIADKETIQQIESIQGYRNVVSCSFSEDLAVSILPFQDFFKKKIQMHFDKNFKIFEKWLSTRNDVKLVIPDGKVCCFPKLTKIKDTSKFVDHLTGKYDTLVVPGEMYGLTGHIRLCFGAETNTIEKGLENLGKALDNYKN